MALLSFFNLILSFSSISTVSGMDELHHDDNARTAVTMENTYQMGEALKTNTLHHTIITVMRF